MLRSTLAAYSLREVLRRPGRSLLTLLGVVIGVASFVAVATSVRFTREAYTALFAPLAPHAPLEVVAEGQGTFTPDLEALARAPGVAKALPVLQQPVGLPLPSGPVALLILGVEPGRESELCECETQGEDGLRLEAGFAARHHLAVGQPVRVVGPAGFIELPLAGLVVGRGPASFNDGAVGFLPLRQAQDLGHHPGQVNTVHLFLTPGASPEQVAQGVRPLLPEGLRVQALSERGSLAGDLLLSLEQCLLTVSVASLVCGLLVVVNAFLMNLADRRRNLTLLRALGVTRRQLTFLLVRESLALAVLGTTFGIPLGIVLAHGLHAFNEYALGVSLPAPRPGWLVLLLAALLGPGLAGLAVLLHAWRAAARDPLEGLSSRPTTSEVPVWKIFAVGLTLHAAGLCFVAALLCRVLTPRQATPLMPLFLVFCLVGSVQLLPVLLPLLLEGTRFLLGPLFGLEGRLALRHLQRRVPRTALTAGVLVVALTVSSAFGTSFLDDSLDIERWYDRTIDGDLLLRVALPDPALVAPLPELPLDTLSQVAGQEGVASVDRVRFVKVEAGGVHALLLARDFGEVKTIPFILSSGEEGCLDRVRQGEVLLAGTLAERLRVRVGDTFGLATRDGPRMVRVAGIGKDYTVGGMCLYMDWGHAQDLFHFRHAHVLLVRAREGERQALGQRLRVWSAERGLLCQRHEEFQAVIARVVWSAQTLLEGLLGLVFVVSGLGIANTLSTFVLEQTRELGVLRALGLTRRQLARLILAQALLLVAVSAVSGLGFGVYLAFLMNTSSPALTGHSVAFHVRPWLLLGCGVGAALLAVVAALIPARRAARLPVIEAVRYE